MRTKYGGVQMDADHELDLAQVTEMTQMISALIEDGHYKDIVESIYKDIGGVVASHVAKLNDAVKQVLETGSPESRLELYKIVAES
jgi:heterodisulfide reductase subunit B